MRRRQRQFAIGSAIFGVVLVVSIALAGMATGSIVWAVRAGIPVVVVALLVFARAFARPPRRRAAMQTCAGCSRKILFEHEAEFCALCDVPVHAGCGAGHRALAHTTDAYR